MEETILRFPLVAEQIFDQLDDQNLTKCRGISKTWYGATERLQWTRKIQKKTKENKSHQVSWKSALVNIPKEFLKKLVLACEEYHLKNSHWQYSPLNYATYSGDLQLFKYIYEKFKDKNPKEPSMAETPFHNAAGHGRLDIFRFIMERAEHKNPKDRHGWTPLHLAASEGHLEICKLICENAYNLNSKSNEDFDGGMTPLHQAAIEGHLEICKLLVLKVADKNPHDKCGFTPLHAAAREGNFEIYKFIAERVENKNPADSDRETPLSLATKNGHEQICRLIYAYIKRQSNQKLSNQEEKRRKKK